MNERRYFVMCENNCLFESMSKEQILAAITQAVTEGTIGNVDGAFVSKILEQNKKNDLSFWVGTEAEFNALGLTGTSVLARIGADGNLYICTDDSTLTVWRDELKREMKEFKDSFADEVKQEMKEFNDSFANEVKRATNVRNLLDNSDFTNPVNQRGGTSHAAGGYGIDRWRVYNSPVTLNAGSVTVGGAMAQRIEKLENGTYTVVAKLIDGTITLVTYNVVGEIATMTSDKSNYVYMGYDVDCFAVGLNVGTYVWVALYEGEYTAETLPLYVAKGYGAELLECQRYYQRYQMLVGEASPWVLKRIYVNVRPAMRIKPTATVTHTGTGTPGVYVRADQTLDITCNSGYADTNIALSADL